MRKARLKLRLHRFALSICRRRITNDYNASGMQQQPFAQHDSTQSSPSSPMIALKGNQRIVGFAEIDIRTLATGPTSYSLLLSPFGLRSHDVYIPLCLAFEVQATETRDVSLIISDVSVELSAGAACRPYVAVSFLPSVCPQVSTSAHPNTSAITSSGTTSILSSAISLQASSCVRESMSSVALEGPSVQSPIAENHLRPQERHNSPDLPELHHLGEGSCCSKMEKSSFRWPVIPTVKIPSCSLANLAHGFLSICLYDADRTPHALIAKSRIPFHDIWLAVIEPNRPHRFTSNMRNEVGFSQETILSAAIRVVNAPKLSQMLAGICTEEGITGARPLIFGVPLPVGVGHISSGVYDSHYEVREISGPSDCQLPHGWVEVVDSFGYIYWHNTKAVSKNGLPPDSWIAPESNGTVREFSAEQEELYDVECVSRVCFRSKVDGLETWVHPGAARISDRTFRQEAISVQSGLNTSTAPNIACSARLDAHEQSQNCFVGTAEATSTGTLDQRSVESEMLGVSETLDKGRPSCDAEFLLPRYFSETRANENSLVNDGGCTTEMRWDRLASMPADSMLMYLATEGHSLTRHGNNTILKFGGATRSNTKLNSLCSFNVDSLTWTRRPAVGQIPIGRVGHGAVAVGADSSRLLVFGGTSRCGRLNDINVFHTENNLWSPVKCSGTAPAPRARHGMATFKDSAFVFGGREGYHYLYARYFNDLHCFNIARSEWLQICPRGAVPRVRSGCIMHALDERLLFVHAGYDETTYFSDTWLFDLVSETWQRLPYENDSLQPSARESHASAKIGNNIIISGGESEGGGFLSDTYLFDAAQLRWAGMPEISGHSPGARSGAAMVAIDHRRVLFSGGSNGFSASSESFMLDTVHAKVSEVSRMTQAALRRKPDAETCVVCLDESKKVDALFLHCGHIVACGNCVKKVCDACPVCRSPVAKVVNLSQVKRNDPSAGFRPARSRSSLLAE